MIPYLSVLIVDGSACVPTEIYSLLIRSGNRVFSADDVHAALKLLVRVKPDLLVADLHMPDMSGLDFVGQVMATDPYVTTIVLCDQGKVFLAQEAILRGCYECLMKPFSTEELANAIKTAVDRVMLLAGKAGYVNQSGTCAQKK